MKFFVFLKGINEKEKCETSGEKRKHLEQYSSEKAKRLQNV